MNAAIMESGSDKKEKRDLLQSAVERFLVSPKGKNLPKSSNNKEDEDSEEEDFI